MSNTNNNLQTQTKNALHNAIMEAGGKDHPLVLAPDINADWETRYAKEGNEISIIDGVMICFKEKILFPYISPTYKFKWAERTILVTEGSSETTTEGNMENYKNVLQDIRNQLDAEAKAVQIILTGIDNDIYSIVDACPNACEMWKAIERLKQGESVNVQDLETNLYWEFRKFTSLDGETLESYYSRFVTLVKQSQELKTVSYHKLYDILKQHQNEVNEIRAKRLACTANPLALVAQQQPVYHPQNHPTHYTQNSSTRLQQAALKIKEKKIDKLMALISLSFKKIYKPTNNNLRTSSNTSRANQDNTPRINTGTRFDNQRAVNVAGGKENVGTQVVHQSGIQCYNCKEYGHVARECQKPKQAKDAAYHKEKMLLYAANNSGPIFDVEPLQKVQNNDDNYNVFANDIEYPEQPEFVNDTYSDEQGDTNITTDSLDMSNNGGEDDQDDDDDLARERDLLASLIEKLKCEIDESKDRVIPSTSVSRPQLKSNRLEDRVIQNNSQGKKQQNENHDMCVLHYINGVHSRTKQPIVVPISTKEPKRNVNQYVATPLKKTVTAESTNQKPRSTTRKQYEHVSKKCRWWYSKITPPGYKWKHKISTMNIKPNVSMPLGTKSRTTNILESITVKGSTLSNTPLSSNSFAARSDNSIHRRLWVLKAHDEKSQASKRVYYVEGLNHNLFSVGQFCDADLEVSFWKSTCYIRDLKGNDLLTGSRGTDLYSITLQDTSTPNLIYLMAKASSSQAWLWHRRLSHLNFDTINLLLKYDIVFGLPKLKFVKDHLCSSCELGKAKHKYTWTHFLRSKNETPEVLIDFLKLVQRGLHAQVRTVRTDKGMEFLNKTLHAYFAQEGIEHQTSTARTPE
ncbi:retrovirus-related pol polyprotein from transposon TNT 1-94 [Tanacetum coccineum]